MISTTPHVLSPEKVPNEESSGKMTERVEAQKVFDSKLFDDSQKIKELEPSAKSSLVKTKNFPREERRTITGKNESSDEIKIYRPKIKSKKESELIPKSPTYMIVYKIGPGIRQVEVRYDTSLSSQFLSAGA